MANVAWRAGNRTLEFDAESETFREAPEANRYLKRTFRKPWGMPEGL